MPASPDHWHPWAQSKCLQRQRICEYSLHIQRLPHNLELCITWVPGHIGLGYLVMPAPMYNSMGTITTEEGKLIYATMPANHRLDIDCI